MLTKLISCAVRSLVCAGAALVAFTLPCVAWAQAPVPGAAVRPLTNTSVGVINSLSGIVFIKRGADGEVPAKSGDLVERGTVISTGAGGEAVLLFPDGQHLSLSPDSALRIDEYQFDARDSRASRAGFSLTAGIMRVVTGSINSANPDAMKISAGDAVIGVRSKGATSFVIEADTKTTRETGSVAVIVGEVFIQRPNGTAITVATDQFTRWQPAISPEQPQPLGAAPARLQAMASTGEAPVVRESAPATARTGLVNSVSGVVLIRSGNGGEVAAKPGDVVDRGTIVSTGASGEAVLLFPDGQHATLSADSILRVDEYQFDASDIKASKGSFRLAAGMMRIVTGTINASNPDAIKVSAGDALISVRSKDIASFVVEADTKFGRETGSVAVIVGDVSIQRPNGTAIAVAAGQFTRWQPTVSPQQSQPVAAAPAYLQAMAAAGEAPQARETVQATARTGVVNSVSGEVVMRNGAGVEVPAKTGDVVAAGSIVSTGTNGEVVLLFADGQHVSLSADSVLRVDEYQYDTRDSKQSRATFALSSGTMQMVTGAIHAANPDALKISAGDAVIGVLSKNATSFVVEAETKIARETGSVAVIAGEVTIQRPDGTVTKVATDQFTRWQPSSTLEPPKALAAAPADLNVAIAASRPTAQVGDVRLEVEAAVKLALAALPATAAGPELAQTQQSPAPLAQPERVSAIAGILPSVTPGASGGCVGSPC